MTQKQRKQLEKIGAEEISIIRNRKGESVLFSAKLDGKYIQLSREQGETDAQTAKRFMELFPIKTKVDSEKTGEEVEESVKEKVKEPTKKVATKTAPRKITKKLSSKTK